jgi:hypothetical protein
MPRQILPNQNKKSERNENDKYLTPYSVIQQLLDLTAIPKDATILEPCSSEERTIATTLAKNGYTNISENIYDETATTDFLVRTDLQAEYIITNTPYGDRQTTAFILKMKQVATKGIYALYPFSILMGSKRLEKIWKDTSFALKEVFIFARPPFLTDKVRPDGKYRTGMTFYAWFYWEKGFVGDPTLKWIDNKRFFLTLEEHTKSESLNH